MDSCKKDKRKLTDLYAILEERPLKLKRGLTDLWVLIFLFIKRGDFALFNDNGFIPSINESILHLLTKNPKEYHVKSFELSNVRVKLFNRYRELMALKKDEMSTRSFIECIRPILILYRDLPEYTKNTKRLSKKTLDLRDAIARSKDPEGIFFDGFPKALGYSLGELSKSRKRFEEYIQDFQNSLSELSNAYPELLNRVEEFILQEVIDEGLDFEVYKESLKRRYDCIKPHRLLKHQKSFISRIGSPIDERDGWLESVIHAVVGKKPSAMSDTEEDVLYDRFRHLVSELDRLSVIHQHMNAGADTFTFDITTAEHGLQQHVVRLPKNKLKKVAADVMRIDKVLGNDKQSRIAILSILLKQELNDE